MYIIYPPKKANMAMTNPPFELWILHWLWGFSFHMLVSFRDWVPGCLPHGSLEYHWLFGVPWFTMFFASFIHEDLLIPIALTPCHTIKMFEDPCDMLGRLKLLIGVPHEMDILIALLNPRKYRISKFRYCTHIIIEQEFCIQILECLCVCL